MNKTAIVIGVLALAGVGAYFYFKPKTKVETTGLGGLSDLGSSDSGATPTTTVPPTGAILETPEQVAETAKKMAEAKELASKITELKKGRTVLLARPLSSFNSSITWLINSNSFLTTIKNTEVAKIDKHIRELEIQLSKLGYTELNGNLVKIV